MLALLFNQAFPQTDLQLEDQWPGTFWIDRVQVGGAQIFRFPPAARAARVLQAITAKVVGTEQRVHARVEVVQQEKQVTTAEVS